MSTELPLADERPDRCETCRFRENNLLLKTMGNGSLAWVGDHETYRDLRHVEKETSASGECHRFPPTCGRYAVPANGQSQSTFDWPEVWLDDWCGEWQAKAAAASPQRATWEEFICKLATSRMYSRIRNAFAREKIGDWGTLVEASGESGSLRYARNFGDKCASEVERIAKECGVNILISRC